MLLQCQIDYKQDKGVAVSDTQYTYLFYLNLWHWHWVGRYILSLRYRIYPSSVITYKIVYICKIKINWYLGDI